MDIISVDSIAIPENIDELLQLPDCCQFDWTEWDNTLENALSDEYADRVHIEPYVPEPSEKDLYGEIDDFKHIFDVGYKYGKEHRTLIRDNEIETVFGKPYVQFTFYEQKAFHYLQEQLEYYFEVCCRSF